MIVGSAPPMRCGVGDNTIALSQKLALLGHRVEIITSTGASEDSPCDKVGISAIMPGWSSFYGGTLLKRILEIEPDIIHLQYPTQGYGRGFAPSLIGMQLKARRISAPFIVTLHEFVHAHPLRKAAIVPLLSEVSAVIFPSIQERDALVKRFATLRRTPTYLIPIGAVLPENFNELKIELKKKKEELKKKWNVPPDGIIVNFGFFQTHKGFELILRVLKALRKDGFKCELWHVGAFDPHRIPYHRFLEHISREGVLKDAVKFLGYLPFEEVAEIFTIARAGVFPFTDGYSDRRSSMITFAQFDVPLITTKSYIPEIDEKVSPFVTLIDRNNADQLKNVLEEIIANEAVYNREAERVSGFRALYDWDMIACQTEEVYRKYLK